MKSLSLLIVLLLSVSLARADDILISLYEYDPWRMVIGSDSPTFILYSEGQVIFWNAELKKYQSTVLNKDNLEAELSELQKLTDLESDYSLSDWSDQPTQVIAFKLGNRIKKISVYGNLRKQEEVRKKAPREFLSKFDYFTSYSKEDAKDWNPTYIEVMIWPYEYAPEKSIVWPSNWPDIESYGTKKRGDSYSIYLPFSHSDELNKFIATRNKKGAVEINGKKWAVSTKTPFPHEISLNKSMQPNANASAD
jgi:hypothetical protein